MAVPDGEPKPRPLSDRICPAVPCQTLIRPARPPFAAESGPISNGMFQKGPE